MKNSLKDRRKDIMKLLAALHLRDAYAMRKLVRRIVPVLMLTVFITTASPSWAKKITDEELAAFLGRPVSAVEAPSENKVSSKQTAVPTVAAAPASEAPAAEKAATVPDQTEPSLFSSKEGELKTVTSRQLPKESPKTRVKKKSAAVDLPDVDPVEEKTEAQTLSVQGEVSGRNNYGLAVTFAMDEAKGEAQEAWFNITKKTKLAGFKSLSDLQEGDRVGVVYRKLAGSNKNIPDRIVLVSKKPPEPASPPAGV